MKNPAKFSLPVFRQNLFYDVCFIDALPNPYLHLKNFIKETLGPIDESIPKV